jgi:hypothetical protein
MSKRPHHPRHGPSGFCTIVQFCHEHHISRSFYYKLRAQGRGPAGIKLGKLTMISVEAAAAWRGRMEADSPAA